MGGASCRCCSEKDDAGPKLSHDLQIITRSQNGQSYQQEGTGSQLILTFSDADSLDPELICEAFRVYIDRKTVKRLLQIQEFENTTLGRLSPEALKIRQKLGPYIFDEGRPMFRSTQNVSSGVDYIGDLGINDKRPNGRGILVTADGSISEGYWHAGKLHGKGRQIHANGDWCLGDWVYGVMEGKGKLQFSDDHYYDGEWKAGLQHGQGEESWPDGARFKGEFKEGQKDGPGIFYWSDGSKYEGELKHNMLDGKGKYLWADGKRYDGDWKMNKMHGHGKFTWPEGKTYEGNYENDQKNGFGTFTWADGRRYEGGWLNNKRHGPGTEYLKGIPFSGTWENGKKVSPNE